MGKKNTDERPKIKKRKKRRHIVPVLLFLILLAALVLGGAFYYRERQKPVKTVMDFLTCVQNMDFDGMSAFLQSQDLSALDNADIRNEAYADFFRTNSSKMTYKILKNAFHIENGTASVTVLLRYIDGEEIYRESITEFLRQMVSTAFSGKQPSEEETRQMLSSILMEKAESMEDVFTESQVTYPLIQIDDDWKIVALDEDTVRIMSSNFVNVQNEINQTLAGIESGETPAETDIPVPNADASLDLDTDAFSIHYTHYRIGEDFGGNPCLLLYYDYTNNGSVASSAMVDVRVQAYQNGNPLEAAVPADNEEAVDKFMAEIQPGETVNVCQAFVLIDESDVTILAEEAFRFGDGEIASQVLKVK